MPLIFVDWITRDLLRLDPFARYVFGDNVQRVGLGGQAAEMRGEPNAIGVATKWTPSMDEAAFFSDQPEEFDIVADDLRRVAAALREGRRVYIPYDGLGTGLSQLPQRAPQIHALIKDAIRAAGGDRRPYPPAWR